MIWTLNVILFAIALLSITVAFSYRTRGWRWFIVSCALALLPTLYVFTSDLLSRPKSIKYEWLKREVEMVQVLGYHIQEGAAIYIMVRAPQHWDTPRLYYMVWDESSQSLAQKLRRAMERGKASQEPVFMLDPFKKYDHSLEEEKFTHAPPQERGPIKEPTAKESMEITL